MRTSLYYLYSIYFSRFHLVNRFFFRLRAGILPSRFPRFPPNQALLIFFCANVFWRRVRWNFIADFSRPSPRFTYLASYLFWSSCDARFARIGFSWFLLDFARFSWSITKFYRRCPDLSFIRFYRCRWANRSRSRGWCSRKTCRCFFSRSWRFRCAFCRQKNGNSFLSEAFRTARIPPRSNGTTTAAPGRQRPRGAWWRPCWPERPASGCAVCVNWSAALSSITSTSTDCAPNKWVTPSAPPLLSL